MKLGRGRHPNTDPKYAFVLFCFRACCSLRHPAGVSPVSRLEYCIIELPRSPLYILLVFV